jgi:hypothetical protein
MRIHLSARQVAFGLTGLALLPGAVWFCANEMHRREACSPTNLEALLALPASALQQVDIGRMNLLCAQELRGADGLDLEGCLVELDKMAARVRSETQRHLYRFQKNPAEFERSEGFFRMLMLAVVLCEDFSVRYNPERISAPGAVDPNDHFFADSRDIFLHGLLAPSLNPQLSTLNRLATEDGSTLNRRTGTCSSLPVLQVAAGRRLGYPLKLVTTKGHLFVRWEDARERFNLEAAGQGVNRFSDDYYRHWPLEITPAEAAAEGYLKSLTPPEELAVFLSIRGMCLREAGRLAEAVQAFAAAARLAPACRGYRAMLASLRASAVLHPRATKQKDTTNERNRSS